MKDVLITGANRGLGIHLARFCLERGDRVFAACRTVSSALKELGADFKGHLQVLKMDVASEASVRKAAAAACRMTKKIDVIVNNAALYIKKVENLPLDEVDLKSAEEMILVNSLGPLIVLKYFIGLVMKSESGVVINVSSEAGSIGEAGRDRTFGYCMSKAALNMMSKLAWNWLMPKGIRMLVVHPGWLRTDMGGPNATDDPAVSAKEIFGLADGPASTGAHLYWDHTGRKMNW